MLPGCTNSLVLMVSIEFDIFTGFVNQVYQARDDLS